MKKILFSLLIMFFATSVWAQCSLTASITTQDSRCAATGEIKINVQGGSGSYNYRVNTNPYTSSNTITGLSKGTYTVYIKDMNTDCEISQQAVVGGNYTDLSFELSKEDLTCMSKVGKVNV